MSRATRRRTFAVLTTVVAVVGLLGVRLVDIQVVRAAEYDEASAQTRTGTQTLYGERGRILDMNSSVLADTIRLYDVTLSPLAAEQTDEVNRKENKPGLTEQAADVDRIMGFDAGTTYGIVTQALHDDPESQWAVVKRDVDVETYEKLNDLDFSWLYFKSHQERNYPQGAVAGNIVGFVNSSDEPEAGVEALENSCLASEDGEAVYRRSLDGVAIPNTTHVTKEATDGDDVQLTIDSDLQYFAQQKLAETIPELGAQYGFVLVEDVKSGKVRVAAQSPTVDPNNVGDTPDEFWGARMFSSPYEPGSTFKALTAAMLLDQGKATPHTEVVAPYRFESGNGADVTDTELHDPERLTLTGVLMESSNTGMSILGSRVGDSQRYKYMQKLGLDGKTAVDFPGESGGILHPASDWDDQTKYATMFGQGLAVTPMQMLSAYQALGNGGVHLPVRLVEGCRDTDGELVSEPDEGKGERVFSADAAKTTLEMLESVSTEGPISSVINIPGYRVAAKTGTAQQPDGNGGYKSQYYVSVMGVVPVDDPQYVISVNIAYPTTITWSMAAAPLFKTITSQVLKTYRVKPSTEPSPDYPPYY